MPLAHIAPERLLQRIKGEYLEMPGLALTLQEAQRLWALDRQTCETVLCGLVQSGFLVTTNAGAFVQASSPNVRPRPSSIPAF
jgi:hypothetical protein